MNIKQLFLALVTIFSCGIASATTVNMSAPGTLAGAISDPASVTTLTVYGTLNAADFDFINSKLTSLTTLNISSTSIVAYDGDEVLLNRKSFPANTLPAYALAGTKIKSITLPSTLQVIGEGALSSSAINAISLPASVTVIGDGAFSNCNNLKSVEIPASVTSLGQHAFSRCDALESVTVSTAVPVQAFTGCKSLKTVVIPINNSVTSIGDKAFMGCTSLTGFPFRSQLTSVGASAFEDSGLQIVDLSAATSLKSLGDWAFAKCGDLSSVIFPEGMTTMGEGCFFEDASLTTVALPSSLTKVPDYAFKGDNSVDTTQFLHPLVTSIGNYALKGMSHLTVFTIPSSVSYIGDEAMADWTAIESLYSMGTDAVPELGKDVWNGIDQSKVLLYVHDNLVDQYRATPQWQEFSITTPTGIDEVTTDLPADVRIKAWWEGTVLNMQAPDDIKSVTIYTLDGRQCLAAAPFTTDFAFDAAQFTNRVYIIRITLIDNTVVTLKISR